MMKPPARLVLLAAVLLPFLLRVILVWQDFERLVKSAPLLEDDFFYCLNIARNVASGSGFSADGETATTGFQWLHQVLCVAVTAPFGARSTAPFRIILTIQVLLSLGAAGVLYRFCGEIWGAAEARLGVFLFGWWVPLFRYGNNGLETILQILLLLGFLLSLARFLRLPTWGGSWRLMAFSFLLVLSRIDMAVAGGTAAIVAAFSIRLYPEHVRQIRRGALLTAGGTALGVLVILASNIAVNGHALPDSGVAVMDLARLYAASFHGPLGPAEIALRGAADVIADNPLSQLLGAVGFRGPAKTVITGLLVLVGVLWAFFRGRSDTRRTRILVFFGGLMGGVLLTLYSLYAPAYWFLSRYLFPLTLLLLMFMLPGMTLLIETAQRRAGRWAAVVLVGLASWYAMPSALRWGGWMLDPIPNPGMEISTGQPLSATPVCHNYDIARWVSGTIDAGERIAMWQGGLVAYLVPHRILHLDGVVNRPAREAWRDGRLDRYLRNRRVDYLVDFRPLVSLAVSRAEGPGTLLTFLGSSACDPGHQVVAYRILR